MELADIKREIEVALEHTDLEELSECMGYDLAHFQNQLKHVLTGEYLGMDSSNYDFIDSGYAFLFKLLNKLNLDDELTLREVKRAKDQIFNYQYDGGGYVYVYAVWDESKVAPGMKIRGMLRMVLNGLRFSIPMEVSFQEDESALEKWMESMIPEHFKKMSEKLSGHGEISHYVYKRSATETFLFNTEGNLIEKITVENVK